MTARHSGVRAGELTNSDLVRMFRTMVLARNLDDAELRLFRQQRAYFTINGAGHEAAQVGAAAALAPSHDWFYPYYRDRAFCLALGVSPEAMLLQALGRRDDPSSGGRQMPEHWGDPELHIISQSSPTGTQFLQAVGIADAARIARQLPIPLDDRPADDEIVFVASGEGATSQGEFFEAINAAILNRLPVLFFIEDNEYAISTPVEQQTPTGSVSQALRDYAGLHVREVDGLDPLKVYHVISEVADMLRAGHGPALVHAHVVRLKPHSNSDNDSDYRSAAEIAEAAENDPILLYEEALVRDGVLDRLQIEALRDRIADEVELAIERASRSPEPDADDVERHLFAGADAFVSVAPMTPLARPSRRLLARSADVERASARFADLCNVFGESGASELNLLESIRLTLARAMARDPRIVVFGQDVADAGRDEALAECKGKGGVFKATLGLQRQFGSHRVFNSPLSEANIVGRAIGMALRGLHPVVEIQFFDYIWTAMMQIRNELGTMRWRSNGDFAAPVVIRAPIGGYLRGGSIYHSQTGEAIFCHCPGIRVVMPSNARDAAGLLTTSIRSGDPVLFLEHKHLYRQPQTRSIDPGADFTIPFGKAEIARAGSDLTVVTYGALVSRSLVAAERVRKRGIDVEVIDLRSLQPYDFETIAESVARTSRLLVASEEAAEFGVVAEIASRAGEELFESLDAPVKRLGAKLIPVPYSPVLENATLPQTDDVERAIEQLARY